MPVFTKDKLPVELLVLQPKDHARLYQYLQTLQPATRRYFGPHFYDRESISSFYATEKMNTGYIAVDMLTGLIVAYHVIKAGCPDHERERLQSYNLVISNHTDATLAPSVADDWQQRGVGSLLYQFMVSNLLAKGTKRLLLWGGVQASNVQAIQFYRRQGFRELGQFEYNGINYDMLAELSP